MRILVTGATGFVGQNLVKQFSVEKQYELICLVRDTEKARLILGQSVELVPISDMHRLKDLGIDVVVHLASFLTSRDDDEVIEKILDANITFGVKLMQSLREQKGIKFINFGSFAEYRSGTKSPDSAYFYTATKRAFRPLLDYYASLADWDYIHLIPYTIYGGINNQKKLIDYVKESLDAKEPILMSPGLQVSDFIHVNDVIDCIRFFLNNTQKWNGQKGEEYHLGTGHGTTIRELASLFERVTGKKCNIQWGGRPYRERDVMYAVAPVDKLIKLGWRAQHSLLSDIQKMK